MQVSTIFLGLALAITAGCDSDSGLHFPESNATQETEVQQTITGDPDQVIRAMFSGASFVSVDQLAGGQNIDGKTALNNWRVSFTADTVTWAHHDVIEIGSYSRTNDSTMVAQFSDREVAFQADGSNLTWDSVTYLRTAKTQFDSPESLVTYFDGTRYTTVEQFDIGESPNGGLAMGNWAVWFSGDEISWAFQDIIAVGTYTYVNDSEFRINLYNQQENAVVLDGGNLLINSKIYEKSIVSQFNSQETLVGFLSGNSYRSVGLKQMTQTTDEGAMGMGLGYWFVDFLDNTMTWAYSGISQVGTIEYFDDNSFTAIFPDTTYTVSVENNDIIFDGTRYSKATGE